MNFTSQLDLPSQAGSISIGNRIRTVGDTEESNGRENQEENKSDSFPNYIKDGNTSEIDYKSSARDFKREEIKIKPIENHNTLGYDNIIPQFALSVNQATKFCIFNKRKEEFEIPEDDDLDEKEVINYPFDHNYSLDVDKDHDTTKQVLLKHVASKDFLIKENLVAFANIRSHCGMCKNTQYWKEKEISGKKQFKIDKEFIKLANEFDKESIVEIVNNEEDDQSNEQEISFSEQIIINSNILNEFKKIAYKLNSYLIKDFILQYPTGYEGSIFSKKLNTEYPCSKEKIDKFIASNIGFMRSVVNVVIEYKTQHPEEVYSAKCSWELASSLRRGDTVQFLGFSLFSNKEHFDDDLLTNSDCKVDLVLPSNKCYDAHEVLLDCNHSDCYFLVVLPFTCGYVCGISEELQRIRIKLVTDNSKFLRSYTDFHFPKERVLDGYSTPPEEEDND